MSHPVSQLEIKRFVSKASLFFVLLGLTVGLACFKFDSAIADGLKSYKLPGDLKKAVLLSEAFAHGSGVAVILLALAFAGVPRRSVLQILIITAGAGVLANGLKIIIPRVRPYARETMAVIGDSATFQEMGSGSFWDAHLRSFPSGHAATAVGFALGLSLIFPKAKWLFLLLALVACYQRLYVEAHYASDVLWGAAIAGLWTYTCLKLPYFSNISANISTAAETEKKTTVA